MKQHAISCDVMTGGPAGRPAIPEKAMVAICDQARNAAGLPAADDTTNCLQCPALRQCDQLQRATTEKGGTR